MIDDHWSEDPDKWPNQPWVSYDDGEGDNAFDVVRRCPKCGRYISVGHVLESFYGLRFVGWKCVTHGDVEPWWEWHYE